MRWTEPQEGETRIRTRFAWLPIAPAKTNEIRWLERVRVEEEYYFGLWFPQKFLEYTPKKT